MLKKTALLVQQGFPNYGVLDFHYCPHKTVFTGCTELPPFCAVCVSSNKGWWTEPNVYVSRPVRGPAPVLEQVSVCWSHIRRWAPQLQKGVVGRLWPVLLQDGGGGMRSSKQARTRQ